MVVSFNISKTSHSCNDSVIRSALLNILCLLLLVVQASSLCFADTECSSSRLREAADTAEGGRDLLSLPVLAVLLLFVQLGEDRA